MNILIACEASQKVTIAFRKLGHEAYSCDIAPAYGPHPEWHMQDDAIKVLYSQKWDVVIAHPPCTRLANSGVHWLHRRNLYNELEAAREFFMEFIRYGEDGNRIGIENPIPHRYGRLPKYSQIIQPWQFGHGETKSTCLWLYGLPKLVPTNIVKGRHQRLALLPPSKDRAKLRSETYQGIADAMAEQWGLEKYSTKY